MISSASNDSRASQPKGNLGEELKAKTGFSSYTEYLRYCEQYDPYVHRLSKLLQEVKPERHASWHHVLILDLSDGNDLKVSYVGEFYDEWESAKRDVFDALYRQPAATGVRIVVWDCRGIEPIKALLHPIGLTLNLNAQVTKAIVGVSGYDDEVAKAIVGVSGYYDDTEMEIRPRSCRHVVIDRNVITFGQYQAEGGIYLPFTLIAGDFVRDTSAIRQESLQISPSQVAADRSGVQHSILRSHTQVQRSDNSKRNIPSVEATIIFPWFSLYSDLLRHYSMHEQELSRSVSSMQFGALFPILRLNNLRFKEQSRRLRFYHIKSGQLLSSVHKDRAALRRWIEDTEDAIDHLQSCVSSQFQSEWLQDPVYKKLENESRLVIAQAQRLEIEVRDYLQIESGKLTLGETKKGFELTNIQIQEGKRVKIFTVLAFIYVPLNLATSTFGMNLQQLNQSGQQLAVFLITAAIAVAITGVSWFCVEKVNSYLVWLRGEDKDFDGGTPTYTLSVRLMMIAKLVYNGHISWLRASEAWPRILMNDPRKPELDGWDWRSVLKFDDVNLAAADYVSRHFWLRGSSSEPTYFDTSVGHPTWK